MRLSRKASLLRRLHEHAYIHQQDYVFDDRVNEDQHSYTKLCSCGDAITVWENHRYSRYHKDATCVKNGYDYEECRACGKIPYYSSIPKLGHTPDYGEGLCTDGIKCLVCGEIAIPPTEHSYKATATIEPTCTDVGYTKYTCSVCGHYKEDSFRQPLGHLLVYTGRYTVDGYEWACTRPGCDYTEIRDGANPISEE